MNLWLDGISALTSHAWAAFVVLFVILWGLLVTRGFLFRIFQNAFTEAELLSISAAGWALPVLFLAFPAFGVSLLFHSAIAGILAAALFFVFSFALIRKRIAFSTLLVLIGLMLPSILLRFAFLKDLVLPAYFDSAEHYRIIAALADVYWTGVFTNESIGTPYHLGFHFLAASIVQFLRLNTIEFMLVFGQILLALLPFAFFFLVRHETGSVSSAFFTCLLAGFGFHMPAHLMNWGKYPALLSVASMLFVFDLAYILYRGGAFKKHGAVIFILCAAVLTSTLIHSRTLVLYGLMSIAGLFTAGWSRLQTPYRVAVFTLLLFLAIIEIVSIYRNPTLNLLFGGYLKIDRWILILILFLSIASIIHYARQTFFLLSWLVLCGLALFAPINLPGLGTQTLLDRPFVQMFIFLPLAIIGGLGFAGLIQTISRLLPTLSWIRRFATLILFGLVLLNIALKYPFYPSDCCRFANRDDLAALTWMDSNLPPDATILIASAPFQVTSFESPDARSGTDAGIWIAPLLSRKVEFAGGEIQFDMAHTHEKLCSRGVDYIYVGSMPQSFDSPQLDSVPGWYESLFSLPSARVYQLLACKE